MYALKPIESKPVQQQRIQQPKPKEQPVPVVEKAAPEVEQQLDTQTTEATPVTDGLLTSGTSSAEAAAAKITPGSQGVAFKEQLANDPFKQLIVNHPFKQLINKAKLPVKTLPAEIQEKQATAKEVVTTPRSAQEDPNFIALTAQVSATAQGQQQHASAASEATVAQAAAPVPTNERESRAQANQVEIMDAAKAPDLSAAAIKAQLAGRIAEMEMPKNPEEAEDFEANSNITEINKQAVGDVTAAKNNSAGQIEQANTATPDTSKVAVSKATPMPVAMPGKTPGAPKTAAAMPPKRSGAAVEQVVATETNTIDTKMDESGVSDQFLATSNEPTYVAALGEKNAAKTGSQEATQNFRNQENQEQSQAQQKAQQQAESGVGAMSQARGTAMNEVVGKQQGSASSHATARETIANKIESKFTDAQTKVNKILDALDKSVGDKFEAAATRAKQKFEDYVEDKMDRYKNERYSGLSGAALWVKDKFMDLPEAVNQFFVDGREVYLKEMDTELTTIAQFVADELKKAKAEIAKGKAAVQEYLKTLNPEERKLAKEATAAIQEKFAGLEEDVNAKKDALVDSLADQYAESLATVDERIEEMKAATKGLVSRAMDAVNGIIEFVMQMKALFDTLLSNIAEAGQAIMDDPIGFFSNLASGVGQGISNFMTNVTKHLQTGLLGWLTGAMGSMSITMPENLFTFKGAFSLASQVLGFGWESIRAIGSRIIGEPVMAALETGFEMVNILKTEGISGLWEHIKEQLGNLKEQVIGGIQEMLTTTVINAGLKWLLSLLNPAAALVKAVMAIIDVVKFFVERAAQIIDLVQAFVESIGAIAKGNVGAVAKSIETALSRGIPLLIGVFASILGLGGITKKVQKIIQKVRKPIVKGIKKLWYKIKKKASKFLKKFKKKGKRKDGKPKQKGLNKGLEVGELVEFKAGKENHELWFNEKGKGVTLWVASEDPKPVLKRLKDWEAKIGNDDSKESQEKRTIITDVRNRAKEIEVDGAKVEKLVTSQEKSPKRKDNPNKNKEIEALNEPIRKEELKISQGLTRLFELFGEQDQIGGHMPTIGKHPMKKEKKKIGDAGKYRESHHVAENGFMKEMKNFYGTVGAELVDQPGFESVGSKLVAREAEIATDFKGGKNLSAILLHRETHRLAKNKAVHSKGLQKEVLENIENEVNETTKKVTIVGIDPTTGVKRPQMQKGAWRSFIKEVYLIAKGKGFSITDNEEGLVIKSEDNNENALKDITKGISSEINKNGKLSSRNLRIKQKEILKQINDTAENAYESALISGLQTVKTSLSKSTFDGETKTHATAIKNLKKLANDIWRKNIIKRIK